MDENKKSDINNYDLINYFYFKKFRMTMIDDTNLIIDNVISISSYSDTNIYIKANKKDIQIYGKNLTIKNLNKERIIILGQIKYIEFL